jgi:GrpB-like predicted nucleotidyltransferase (UPF0157 family)
MHQVKLVNHNKEWISRFKKESTLLQRIFGDELAEIHHIGSTSIPAIKAKPTIDIMPVVKTLGKVDEFNQLMTKNGYKHLGENNIPRRRFFTKDDNSGNRLYNVHVFQFGDHHVTRHIAFRKYLNNNSEIAKEYEDLKLELATMYPRDLMSYSIGKDKFIKEIEKKAVIWFTSK